MDTVPAKKSVLQMFFLGLQPKKNLDFKKSKHSGGFGAALVDKTRQARKNLLPHYSTGRPVSAQHAWHVHLFWLILVNPIQYMIFVYSIVFTPSHWSFLLFCCEAILLQVYKRTFPCKTGLKLDWCEKMTNIRFDPVMMRVVITLREDSMY